jgi:membrane fusion protein, adhesin transport system
MSGQGDLVRLTPVRRSVARTTYLAQSIRLEDGTAPALVRGLIFTLGLAIVGAVAWSTIAVVDQVARADGQVMPSSTLQVVQHLEGGIAASVPVREGDLVEEGQVIVVLDPTQARSELTQLQAREASRAIRLARLNAFVAKAAPDFGRYVDTFPQLIAEQEAILATQNKSQESQVTVLKSQIAERRLALSTLAAQRGTVVRSIALIEEEAKLREELLRKGLTPRFQYLDVLRLLNNTRGQLLQIEGLIARARENVGEAENRLVDLETRAEAAAVAEIGALSAELAEVRESLARYQDRVTRLEVRAPVRGLVQRVAVTPGGVIAPGMMVAEIVPAGDALVVEVRLNPKDVGTVEPGMPATLRFNAYDFARFGGIEGTVRQISATTLTTASGSPYYKVVVAPQQMHVGRDPNRNPVLPGMVVQADIRAGRRTLFEYLTKPISRALSTSFSER